jgi:hypothetical protein
MNLPVRHRTRDEQVVRVVASALRTLQDVMHLERPVTLMLERGRFAAPAGTVERPQSRLPVALPRVPRERDIDVQPVRPDGTEALTATTIDMRTARAHDAKPIRPATAFVF